jgi:hypothetical protein
MGLSTFAAAIFPVSYNYFSGLAVFSESFGGRGAEDTLQAGMIWFIFSRF